MRNALVVLCLAFVTACSSNAASTTTTASSSDANANAVAVASPVVDPTGGDLYYGSHLPPGPELTDLKNSCEICHSGDMYATQRLSKAIWTAEVTKMMKFGSPLPKADKTRVIAYLTKYLGTTVPRSDIVPTATAPPLSYANPPAAQ